MTDTATLELGETNGAEEPETVAQGRLGLARREQASNTGRALVRTALLIAVAALSLVAAAAAAPLAYVANGFDDTVSVINTESQEVLATVPVGDGPTGIAVSSSDGRVYVASTGGPLSIIDGRTNLVTATVSGLHASRVALDPAGRRAYVTTAGLLAVVDTGTTEIVATVPVGGGPYGVAVSPDGTRAFTTNTWDVSESNPCSELDICLLTVSVIDTATNSELHRVQVGAIPGGIAVSPSGKRLYVACSQNTPGVWVIDTTFDTVIAKVPVPSASFVAVHPSGERVYVSGVYDVAVVDAETNTLTAAIPVPTRSAGDLAVTPDGTRVYVISQRQDSAREDDVLVIDTATNSIVDTIAVGHFASAIAIGGDSTYVTPLPTPTSTPTPSPTPSATPRCPGDCDGGGRVTVDELLIGVRIALGEAPPDDCPGLDTNGDAAVTVDELVRAVQIALSGCS